MKKSGYFILHLIMAGAGIGISCAPSAAQASNRAENTGYTLSRGLLVPWLRRIAMKWGCFCSKAHLPAKRVPTMEKTVLLAEHGFFAANIDYRPSETAKFPAAVEDCK